MNAKENQYTESFGFQWNRFKKTQFDSYSGFPITRLRLERILGQQWAELKNANVLECGCGAGRFTEILVRESKHVFAVDSSSAALVNTENIKALNYEAAQLDILNLVGCEDKFDFVFALGVVQHTPDSEQTIAKIYTYVKPGGYLVFDHYTFKKSYFSLRLIYRLFLKQMPPSAAFKILDTLKVFFLPIHKQFAQNKILSIALNRFSPFITYYNTFPQLNDHQQAEWALLDTFDSLTDHHKRFRNKKQIFNTLLKMNTEIIRCEYGGNGVEAVCRKPLTRD